MSSSERTRESITFDYVQEEHKFKRFAARSRAKFIQKLEKGVLDPRSIVLNEQTFVFKNIFFLFETSVKVSK
jgi:hypothetical protein